MHSRTRVWMVVSASLTGLLLARDTIAQSTQAAFAAENRAAMSRMMSGMDVKPSGDIDRDFAAMMIPHHQGAIDMAVAELRHGRNEQLRRIAQEIVVEQQQEIEAMMLATLEPLPRSAPAPTGGDLPPTRGAVVAPPSAIHISTTIAKGVRK